MFIAAMLMYCPNVKITVFAVAMRAATNLVALINQMISSHPQGEGRVQKHRSSADRLRVRGPPGSSIATDERVVTALPSKSETTRGFHSDVVVVDEMAFITEKLLMETILPTLARDRTCLVRPAPRRSLEQNVFTRNPP
jgi:phage terminase large subunit-like protein